MWWHGRGNSGGSWLPGDKKANMWHRRGNSGGSWLPGDKKANMWHRSLQGPNLMNWRGR